MFAEEVKDNISFQICESNLGRVFFNHALIKQLPSREVILFVSLQVNGEVDQINLQILSFESLH